LDSAIVFLANPHLIDLFVRISVSCTSAYNFRAVDRCLDRVGKFFISAAGSHRRVAMHDTETVWHAKHAMLCLGTPTAVIDDDSFVPPTLCRLPPTLDEDLFFEALRILLDSEHAHTLVCTLRFMYRYMEFLSDSLHRRIMKRIMKEHEDAESGVIRSLFVKLFCFWSEDVRRIFHHILTYKAFRVKRTFLGLISDETLVGASASRHVYVKERPPHAVREGHTLANDSKTAFSLDFYVDQLQTRRRVVKTRRRSGAAIASSSSKPMPLALPEQYYVYGDLSLKEYTATLVGYYTRVVASDTGIVVAVDMAEIVFGGGGNRRGD